MLWLVVQVREPSAVVEHEASTSKIGEDQLFYFQQRGVEAEAAVGMIISGFCRCGNQQPNSCASVQGVNVRRFLELAAGCCLLLTALVATGDGGYVWVGTCSILCVCVCVSSNTMLGVALCTCLAASAGLMS